MILVPRKYYVDATLHMQLRLSVIEFSTVPIENSGGTAVVPEHADNAAALSAGLTIGNFYRTGDFLKVVH